VGAVRRARNPGHHHKSMLVLKGDQFCGKTPFVKILAGDRYHSLGNGDIADRDTILECQGKWLVEAEELSALGKADANALKTAIGRTHDVITKKYQPDGVRYPRSFVLVGTTNKDEFLTDDTGNGRYWVVEIPRGKKIDLERLERVRDLLWAEADFLARTEPANSNELDAADKSELDEQNKAFLNVHPWETDIRKFLRGKEEVHTAAEVLMHILKGDATKATKKGKDDVADVMRALKCVQAWRQDETDARKRIRYWKVPADISGVQNKQSAAVVDLAGRRRARP
jgi:predicted P-loop ATPase